jgi:hypothetical protein
LDISLQCCEYVTFWYGSGSADPYNPVPNPDSDLAPDPTFSSVTLNANRKIVVSKFFCFLLFLYTFKQSSKIKSHKEVAKQYKSRFFLQFLLDDRRIRILEAQHIPIPTKAPDPQHMLEGR